MATYKGKTLQGFTADIRHFQRRIKPAALVSFQKKIAFELYRRILQKTPVDKGFLRGSWTISIGQPDKTPANQRSSAPAFDTPYQGSDILPQEVAALESGLAQMAELEIGQIIWISNAMPYVLRIEFDGHSSEKAPQGMVQLSINEVNAWMRARWGRLWFKVGEIGSTHDNN